MSCNFAKILWETVILSPKLLNAFQSIAKVDFKYSVINIQLYNKIKRLCLTSSRTSIHLVEMKIYKIDWGFFFPHKVTKLMTVNPSLSPVLMYWRYFIVKSSTTVVELTLKIRFILLDKHNNTSLQLQIIKKILVYHSKEN